VAPLIAWLTPLGFFCKKKEREKRKTFIDTTYYKNAAVNMGVEQTTDQEPLNL
jgi:hypothetical protein